MCYQLTFAFTGLQLLLSISCDLRRTASMKLTRQFSLVTVYLDFV
ncbi:hypothetical protein GLYMA_03G022850v4 [Glycine max]|nr:hypothetical protein GLYMA_03G022850v4 [Glycine max]KAH1068312.1 hypothetical protein GYH30_006025 [Glycine max]